MTESKGNLNVRENNEENDEGQGEEYKMKSYEEMRRDGWTGVAG